MSEGERDPGEPAGSESSCEELRAWDRPESEGGRWERGLALRGPEGQEAGNVAHRSVLQRRCDVIHRRSSSLSTFLEAEPAGRLRTGPGAAAGSVVPAPAALIPQNFRPPLYNPGGVCPMVRVNSSLVCIHKHMSSEFFLLNTRRGTISPTRPAPIALYGTSLASCSGRYVLAVGGQSTVYLNVVMRLDLLLDEWALLVGCPFPPAKYVSSIVMGSRFLLVFGGYGDYYSQEMWLYDMLARSWSGVELSRARRSRMYVSSASDEDPGQGTARSAAPSHEGGNGKSDVGLASSLVPLGQSSAGGSDSRSASLPEMQDTFSHIQPSPSVRLELSTGRGSGGDAMRQVPPNSHNGLMASSAPVLCFAEGWLYIFGGRGYSYVFRIHVTEIAECCTERQVGRALLWYFYRERYSHTIAPVWP